MTALKYFVEGGFIAIAFALMVETAAAYTGIGTGYYGDGTVIKEEPSPWYDNRGIIESYSVTEDTVNGMGFVDRETTTFDCMDNFLGEKTCTERRW